LTGLDQYQAGQRHDKDFALLEHIIDWVALLRDPKLATMAYDYMSTLVAPRSPQRPSLQGQMDLALIKIGKGPTPAPLRKIILILS
jgi:hypothetical protein